MYECVEWPVISDNMAAASCRNNHHSKFHLFFSLELLLEPAEAAKWSDVYYYVQLLGLFSLMQVKYAHKEDLLKISAALGVGPNLTYKTSIPLSCTIILFRIALHFWIFCLVLASFVI
jgi:hypothetical protein